MSDTEENAPISLEGLGSFDFTPSWAKSTPEEGMKRFHSDRYNGDRGDDRRGGDRGPRKDFGNKSPRKPFDGPRKDFGNRGPRKDFGNKGPRKDFDRGPRAPRAFTPPPPPLDVEVRVLPEQKALGAMIRKIQTAYRAFPIKDIAYLFLDNPSSCLLRITPKKPAEGEQAKPVPEIFQCKQCGMPSLDRDALIAHIMSDHLADFFDIEEIDCEPPKGNFSCVAKCGLSGILIGPPNLHDYQAKIAEIRRTRYPHMSEEQYRSHIEMIRDSEKVEEWRKTATRKTVYRLKSAKPAEGEDTRTAMDRSAAEVEFTRNILPTLVVTPKTLITTAEAGLKSPSRQLQWAMRDALNREDRFPASLAFALRGAFHHRKLLFFRANEARGPEFVTCVKPAELDAAHAVPVLTAIVKFVEQHPLVPIAELVAKMTEGDESMRDEVMKSLSLLIEKGHLVAYFDERLALPAQNPVFKRLPKSRVEAPKPVEKTEETKPEAAAEPVAEASVEAPVEAPAEVTPEAAPAAEAPAEQQ